MVAAGPVVAALVVGVVAFGLALVTALSRVVGLNERLGSLLAAGASVCGVSAIAAVAPACGAEDDQIAHAAATVLLFDAVTLVAFPAVGRALGLEPRLYGVWIGLSMFSTGPVAAAGFAHSPTAGTWATLTKLARNTLIGAVAVWYSVRYADRRVGTRDRPAPAVEHPAVEADRSMGRLWTDFPKFLVGFLVLAVVANAGLLSAQVVGAVGDVSDALFLLAFAGLGFEISVDDMRETGLTPVGVVGASLLVVSGVSYALVTVAL